MRSMVERMSVTALGRNRSAVAEFRHQRFGRVRQRLQARQADETAGALDRVDDAENVGEDFRVVGLLLETHELDVGDVETLVRLYQEFPEQFVHCSGLRPRDAGRPGRIARVGQFVAEAINFC